MGGFVEPQTLGIVLAFAVHLYREMNVTVESSHEGGVLTVAPRGVLWFASVSRRTTALA